MNQSISFKVNVFINSQCTVAEGVYSFKFGCRQILVCVIDFLFPPKPATTTTEMAARIDDQVRAC